MMFVKAVLPVLAGALFVNAAAFDGRAGKREDVGSILDAVTSDAGSVFSQGTAAAGSVLGDLTSLAGDAATFLTSLGGDALTVISSADGELITLAPSGFGEVTSFAGSVYTEITGDAASLLSQATSAVGSLVGDSHSTSATGVATAGAGTATATGTGDSATTVTSTSTATGSPNGALGLSTFTMTTPLMSGLTSVFASMLLDYVQSASAEQPERQSPPSIANGVGSGIPHRSQSDAASAVAAAQRTFSAVPDRGANSSTLASHVIRSWSGGAGGGGASLVRSRNGQVEVERTPIALYKHHVCPNDVSSQAPRPLRPFIVSISTMFAKSTLSVFYALAACALFVNAAAVEDHLQKRQDVGSIIDSLTSDAGSIVSQATAGAGSVISDITSAGGDVATLLTSIGGKAATIITSAGGEAITLAPSGFGVATSFAGSVYTEVTGDAASVFSQATSAAGSLATGGSSGTASATGTGTNGNGTATQSPNAALSVQTITFSTPLLSGIATAFASMFVGAWVAL
ncbi:hypothetical protein ONZ51_g5043 [Trametes cubensis]|uniref:Uncharacterized protein n=1 Tax=Trametes cubensis TaxID=1111947 RepID=A0AAD7TUQ4_9APHY|nr:hypothetical protein ONZ51_g5043 [Trametes cubensis]